MEINGDHKCQEICKLSNIIFNLFLTQRCHMATEVLKYSSATVMMRICFYFILFVIFEDWQIGPFPFQLDQDKKHF